MSETSARDGPARREFHISRAARDRYRFADDLFGLAGNVVLADFRAARELAHRINTVREPAHAVGAGALNAMGLIDEAQHLVVADYRRRVNPRAMADALTALEGERGRPAVDELLTAFADRFPPTAVYRSEQTVDDYLAGETGGVPHRELALEELLLLWVANSNPAFAPFRELFDDRDLRDHTRYLECIEGLRSHFSGQPAVAGLGGGGLVDELLRPIVAAPDSLEGQLEFIRRHWARVIGPSMIRLLSSLDLLAEESRPWFAPGPGPVEVPTPAALAGEPEAFSPDQDWMPRLVLMSKNAYVWLDQLSRRYGRSIATLDAIPDQELDRLAGWGFTGLWLIGVWQRSPASARIKRMMGDQDAVASAYSLLDYRIADDLGGEAAFLDLKDRAWRRGIRMATDMVPNHVGIDSRWVIEHPDWFIGLDEQPFPAYQFTGADLCDDERVGIYIEDHYWDRSDAAVVFKRVDHWTGDARYIYHGNDGTSMPWNDTAQLDYRLPEVREAVIQTILHVARLSPIIRFDAAMTLTKRHYHRLWFPEPGSGGDIPSRAGHGMTRSQFDAAMPREFWREVVDRVAAEAPDTLLLAEAFWLLEGYFVRTLGMHRVYNSAFMNMLRDERNADYRRLVRETVEFDPQILKRYVNFMSNPDERTAVDQFGKDGKYFGVATLMATLPGLPMFGHGQVEGLAEKYGMEFRRPRWDEQSDEGLVTRHERQLFPLLHRRRIFAEAEQFQLLDFVIGDGAVDDNVFAYSNRDHGEASLVIYHNRYAESRGWVRGSAAGHGPSLGETVAAPADGGHLAFRDIVGGLEYLRAGRELHDQGLYVELGAYDSHVFLDFRPVHGDRYRRLAEWLGGRGVPSLEDALFELELAPVLDPFRRLVAGDSLLRLASVRTSRGRGGSPQAVLVGLESDLRSLAEAVRDREGGLSDASSVVTEISGDLETILRSSSRSSIGRHLDRWLGEDLGRWATLVAWVVTRRLSGLIDDRSGGGRSDSWLEDWLLVRSLTRALAELGVASDVAGRTAVAVRVVAGCHGWWDDDTAESEAARRLIGRLIDDPEGRRLLGIHTHDDTVWFRAEGFEQLVGWLLTVTIVESAGDRTAYGRADRLGRRLNEAAEASGYRVADLIEALDSGTDS